MATEGLFAPTIRYHCGIFYIVCTNAFTEGVHLNTSNFYITTRDIWSNNWGDPIYFDFHGIDPSLFFDDDGRVYVQGSHHAGPIFNPQCSIHNFEIDIATGRLLSEAKSIWTGFLSKGDVEGPHIYKKDGYYYLMAAEGGTWEHHLLSIARSTSIWGPYETYGGNPILTADGKNEYIHYTGHGELFQDGDGQWWAAVLAVRKDSEGRLPLGRESFLASVSWSDGGWPTIAQPKMSFERHTNIDKTPSLQLPVHNTNTSTRDPEYIHIRDAILTDYIISTPTHEITLIAREANLSMLKASPTFIGKRQRALNCTVTTTLKLNHDPSPSSSQAGLSLYKDPSRHVNISYDYPSSSVRLDHTYIICGKVMSSTLPAKKVAIPRCNSVGFRIVASADMYEFFYRIPVHETAGMDLGNGDWVSLGSIDSIVMSDDDFTGPIFGVFATALEGAMEAGPGRGEGQSEVGMQSVPRVEFEGFEIENHQI